MSAEGRGKKVGSWQLAVGSWQLAVGSWQLAVGSWQLRKKVGHLVSDTIKKGHLLELIIPPFFIGVQFVQF